MSLKNLLKMKDVEGIKAYCREHNLHIRDGKILPKDEQSKASLKEKADFWHSRQQARKILLG